MNDLTPKENYLPPSNALDPVLEGVKKRFKMDEEFRIFLDRNEFVRNSRPDVGFLLFLIESQREAILDLEMRVSKLEGQKEWMRQSYQNVIMKKEIGCEGVDL